MSTAPSARLLQHVSVTAEVASFLAYRATQAGISIDRRLVETAALLHDVDKALPREHPLRELGHGVAGAAWVSEAGHPELSRPLQAHPVMRLVEDGAGTWVQQGPLEDRLVAYADKRATQRVVSLDQRFARWARKHPRHASGLARARVRAGELEAGICRSLGIAATDVERLRWVDDAIARAHAQGALPELTHSNVEGLSSSGDSTVPA